MVATTITTRFSLLLHAAGLIFIYSLYGVLQEKIMKSSTYGPDKEHFTSSSLLIVFNRIFSVSVGLAILAFKTRRQPENGSFRQRLKPASPYFAYALVAACNFLSTSCQYQALRYVSYTTQSLAKTSKMVPVLVVGALVWRKKYMAREWVAAGVILVGCATYLFAAPPTPHGSHAKSASLDADSTFTAILGAAFLLGYLFFDGLVSTTQERVFGKNPSSSDPFGPDSPVLDQMIWTNIFACMIAMLASVASSAVGDFGPNLRLLLTSASLIWDVCIFSAASALGLIVLLNTIASFGALTSSLIMTIRQFLSILINAGIFGNFASVSLLGWTGVFWVASGIWIKINRKYDPPKQPKVAIAALSASADEAKQSLLMMTADEKLAAEEEAQNEIPRSRVKQALMQYVVPVAIPAIAALVLAPFVDAGDGKLDDASKSDSPWRVPVALALLPHIAVGIALLSSVAWIGWIHIAADRTRRSAAELSASSANQPDERERLLSGASTSKGSDNASSSKEQRNGAWTGRHLVLDVLKVVLATAVVTTSAVRLIGLENAPQSRWTRVYEGGVISCILYFGLVGAAKVADPRLNRLVHAQHIFLSIVLVTTVFLAEILPFLFVRHPPVSTFHILGFTQTALVCSLGLLLSLTPTIYTPSSPDMPPAPAQTASPLSRLFFVFLEGSMYRYFARTSKLLSRFFHLDHSSLDFKPFVPPLPDYLHSDFVLGRFRWEGDSDSSPMRKKASSSNTAVIGRGKEFVWRHKRVIAEIIAFATGWIVFIFLSPLSMNLLLRYVQQSEAPPLGLSPYLFVLLIFLAPIAMSVCYQAALYRVAQLGLRLRAILGHAIYAKLLRIKAGGGSSKQGEEDKKNSGGSQAVGRVNNLVGTDIDTITSSLPTALQLYAVLPKLIVSIAFLYVLLGWSAFVALGAILLFAPVSNLVSRRYGAVQEEIMKATDKRITLVQELLNSIRTLKMFAWEKPSMERIGEARRVELERVKKRAKVYAGLMFLSTGVPAVVTLSTFGCYIFVQKQSLTASTAFTAMSLFGLLREAVISATYLLSAWMRARVSLDRITSFLTETEDLDDEPVKLDGEDGEAPETAIEIAAGTEAIFSRYAKGAFALRLGSGAKDATLRIPRGKTTIVAGDVGSGKSAFLLALLGELHVAQGEIKIYENASAESALFSYAAQSPWLQDTSIRENILFGEDFDEERYNETIYACALEDDLEAMPQGDETRVGEKGLSMSGGQKQRIALARAVYSSSRIVLLDDVLSALDSNMVSHVVDNCLNGPLLHDRTVVLVSHFVKLCTSRIASCELLVTLKGGRVASAGSPSDHLDAKANGLHRSPSSDSLRSNASRNSRRSFHDAHVKHGSDETEYGGDSSGEGHGISFSVYRQYAAAMGGLSFWIPYALVNIVAHVFMIAQGWYVGRWVNAPDRDAHAGRYFTLYATIQMIASVALTAMYLVLIWGAIRASRLLHDRLTRRVFAAPFRWWDKTPLGNVLNRFSKDTEVQDTEQVENLQPVLDYSVQVLFVAIVITVVLPVFLLPAAVISFAFFCLGRLYLRNALAARKEVAAARSPLFSTLGDSTSGVTTIRAYGRSDAFATRYKSQTDNYNKIQLCEEGLDRWLELRADMTGALVSFVIGILCLSSGLSSGITGFLISTGLEFTSRILYVVRAINKNELSLNSVQRIIQYSTEVETEEVASEQKAPPASWPDSGAIEFDGFSAKYSPDSENVLHKLTLQINPGEKIGIVGPSGCGKSTLSLALLRFILTSDGSITIDGRKLSETNLEAIRSRITLVPQDPTLFSGTLRSNLDPTDEHDDATLWNAIKRCGIAKSSGNVSLETPVASSGSNFSQGQRQLIGLARALVRSSRVIIMDEATASLDDESDELVQKVIREEFSGCTNLTVAHRLDTIIDFDRILVLRAGRVAEFDKPVTLLDREDSAFRNMVEATGRFDELYERAQKAGAESKQVTQSSRARKANGNAQS
ncbi:hypothetical protein JCM10908_006676 [Rhodotorula pacifica]|uniref:uncharacterized protein n=1 Tax=Rhodotorula pacifica TaxID=1495444 RepID=UPI00317AEFBF